MATASVKYITEEELRKKITKESSETLIAEIVEKGLKTDDEAKKLERQDLIQLVFDVRKTAMSVPSSPNRCGTVTPQKVAPTAVAPVDLGQFLQFWLVKESKDKAERDAKESKDKAEREAKEYKDSEDRKIERETKENKDKAEREAKESKDKAEREAKENKDKVEKETKESKELKERIDRETTDNLRWAELIKTQSNTTKELIKIQSDTTKELIKTREEAGQKEERERVLRNERENRMEERFKKANKLMRGVLTYMPSLPADMPSYFEMTERTFTENKINSDIQVIILKPYLTDEAKKLLCNVPVEDVKTYTQIKKLILQTNKLTPGKYKEMFSTAEKKLEETFAQYAHRLSVQQNYYLNSQEIKRDYRKLVELMICDKFK